VYFSDYAKSYLLKKLTPKILRPLFNKKIRWWPCLSSGDSTPSRLKTAIAFCRSPLRPAGFLIELVL
jgi:hypothetical protein